MVYTKQGRFAVTSLGAGTWILNQPLNVLASEDHPYLETALGTLGGHEVAVHLAPGDPDQNVQGEFRIFLDGVEVFEMGDATPGRPWFQLCQELGFEAEAHWDWDPALILFQQVIPALAQDWHEVELPYTDAGVPEGVLCLGTLRRTWNERVRLLHTHPVVGADRLVADLFHRLPLRAVVLHDDPERRVDFVGNPMDTPYLGEFLHLGVDRARSVVVSRVTLQGTGGMRWSPWLPGGAWRGEGREFVGSQGPQQFLEAAGLGAAAPEGFKGLFKSTLERLCAHLEPFVEAYRESYPAGVAWHRDPKDRYLERTIVDVRMGAETVLILDDGSEVVVAEHRERSMPTAAVIKAHV
jgi:hypothetical protein